MASSANSNFSTWEEVRDQLRKFREDNVRCSEEVVEIADSLLADHANKLGDEAWIVYEQLFIASLDIGKIDVASACIRELNIQFPNSIRVRKLMGMRYEALQKYDEALNIYEDILEEDESNSVVRKRYVAIHKARRNIPAAIKLLNDHVKKFSADHEAWMELADLYISEQEYSKAAYCVEELILSNPHNHLYHQRYAEIKYTQGEMPMACKYFSQAAKLNGDNMRALYGIFMSASNLAGSPKGNAKTKKDNMKYAAWAARQISEKYKSVEMRDHDAQVEAIEEMLDSLQVVPSTN
ncbi:ER membrane protein complex subunit 2-like [Saccoglossus kowalevskii]|uniref:ER membrane protein complex subunit 2 n=1 Tax=Saccoglossus kowalevskii TaxID=10224 RepID=A0ABM0GJK4_SACKO|nr:PREDICTED: ER membrane protein complex subunit 2-like [Saccoglossus kowalevskii]